MRHLVRALLASAAIALLAPTAASANFSFGVAAGEVTSDSAKLWARSDQSGLVVVKVATDPALHHIAALRLDLATHLSDLTVQRTVYGLKPGTRYWYRFIRLGSSDASAVGTFVTAPGRNDNAPIRFAWTGDTDATPGVGQTQPFWNNFDVFKRMQEESNQFNVHLGDTIYSDSEVPGTAEPGRAHRRAEVGQVQAQPRPGEARQPARLGRLLLAVGRPRVHQRLLALRERLLERHDQRPAALPARPEGLHRLRAGRLQLPRRAVPDATLGQEPGALLPRRAILPLRQGLKERRLRQPDQRPARPGANRAAEHPQPVLGPGAVARGAGVAGLPGGDQRPEPDLPWQAAVERVPLRHPPLRRPLQGDHQRDADPAVLRASPTTTGAATRPIASGCCTGCRV